MVNTLDTKKEVGNILTLVEDVLVHAHTMVKMANKLLATKETYVTTTKER